jgi:hypothetical protein
MTRFQWRRNTAAGAASNNAVLAAGEPGVTTDTHVLKVGDGATAWVDLPEVGSLTYGRKSYISLAEFGPAGNGVTDDTAAISAWVAALSAGPHQGYIPAGTFLTDPLTINMFPGLEIFGDGMLASTLLCRSATGDLLTINQASTPTSTARNPRIRDLSLKMPSGAAGNGLVFRATPSVVMSAPEVRRCRIDGGAGAGAGILFDATVDWVLLDHCQVMSFARGLYLGGGTKLVTTVGIENCVFAGGSIAGVHASGAFNLVTASDCEFSFNAVGFLVDGTSPGTRIMASVENSRFEANTVSQANVSGLTSAAFRGIEINDNAVGLDNEIILGQNVRDAEISRVYVRGINANGAIVQEASTGIRAQYSSMETAIGSIKGGAGTAYMRRDSAGNLYSPIAGRMMNGQSHRVIAALASDYDMTTGNATEHYIGLNCTAADRTFTLPDATRYRGREYVACRESAGTHSVILAASAGQSIVWPTSGAAASVTLIEQWQSLTVVSDGTQWVVTASNFTVPITTTKPSVFTGAPQSSSFTLAANALRGSLIYLPRGQIISKARIRVGTSSGNISVAVYTVAGTTRLLTTGAIACPTGSQNADVSFTGSATLSAGVYFAGLSADNGTASFYGMANSQIQGSAVTSTAHPAPSTVNVDDGSAGTAPCIGLF